MKAYPLRFQPIFKERLWGGQKLKTVLQKNIPNGAIGESWELSDVEGDVSVIDNGLLKGKTLREALNTWGADLLGIRNFEKFGYSFPLLIKFIDAQQDLSIQVHPDDALAQKRHACNGKTEMWYVMQAASDAKLIVGFNQTVSKELYQQKLSKNKLTDLMNYEHVQTGDTFFIKTGTIHAIGAGVLLAEIQQTSDITYRVYDFDRKDANGNTRALHTQEALEAINFSGEKDFLVDYTRASDKPNKMVTCPYFTTLYREIDSAIHIDLGQRDSFTIFLVVSGQVAFAFDNQQEILQTGEVILVPARVKNFNAKGDNAKVLEVFV
ncbi:MAG: type I phosphomannose isomerase catalytic subunit [Flavobacteriaceae bacterium]|nr:type I phosphomannose isomerase catalytic subunit [Flavobacteriaceae bacterium]